MGSFEKRASGLDTKMEDVRQAFLIRLARKGEDLHQTLIEISENGPLPELRDAIARNAHQTAGVAASFGYRELGVWSKPRWIHKSSQRAGMSMIKVNQAYWKAFLQCRLIALSCGTVFQI